MTDYREKDTVVVSDGGERGTGLGMIAGILLVIVLLLAVWYITPGSGGLARGVLTLTQLPPCARVAPPPGAPSPRMMPGSCLQGQTRASTGGAA